MPNWTIGDWLTYLPFILAAVLMALTQALRDIEGSRVPAWLKRPFLNYVPLLLLIIGSLAFAARQFGPITRLLDGAPQVSQSGPSTSPSAAPQPVKKYPRTDADVLIPALRKIIQDIEKIDRSLGPSIRIPSNEFPYRLSAMFYATQRRGQEPFVDEMLPLLQSAKGTISEELTNINSIFANEMSTYRNDLGDIRANAVQSNTFDQAISAYIEFLNFVKMNNLPQNNPTLMSPANQIFQVELETYKTRLAAVKKEAENKIEEVRNNIQ